MSSSTASPRFVAPYIALAYGVSWSILGGYLFARQQGLLSVSPKIATTLATLGPALAALATSRAEAGRRGLRELLTGLRRPSSARWYVLAFAWPASGTVAAFGTACFGEPRFLRHRRCWPG